MFVDLCTKVNNVLVSLIHAQGFLKFVLGDRDDILKDRNYLSKYRDGRKARI